MSPRARLAAGVALAALGLAACGRKGPPVAPEARVPQAVADLAAVVRESAIELTWTNPPRRVDRTPLRDLTRGFVVAAYGPPDLAQSTRASIMEAWTSLRPLMLRQVAARIRPHR